MSMIAEVTSVSSKGQVVLPKAIRDEMDLDTGSVPDLSEYESLMKESKKWAEKVGMKQSDIDDAVKSVRKRKRTKWM